MRDHLWMKVIEYANVESIFTCAGSGWTTDGNCCIDGGTGVSPWLIYKF